VKKIICTMLLFFTWIGVAVATPINWETASPTTDGVNIHQNKKGTKVNLGADTIGQHNQPIGIYGAGFYTALGGELDLSIVLRTLDSWNLREGQYDRLAVSTSSEGYYWNNPSETEEIVQLGGTSWTDGKIEKYSFRDSLTLKPGEYFSFFLETSQDSLYSSAGTGKFNFTANEAPAPVPEPATTILFATGLAGLARLARKKR
jgi:hypothetical protein